MVHILQSRTDRTLREARRISAEHLRDLAVIERGNRTAMRKLYKIMIEGILERLEEIGPDADAETLLPSGLYLPDFKRLQEPWWLRGIASGIRSEQQLIEQLESQDFKTGIPAIDAIFLKLPAIQQKAIRGWLAARVVGFWSKIESTVQKRLRRILGDANVEGKTLPEMTKEVRKQLGNISKSSAERIARTESNGSMNYGHQVYREAKDVTEKQWISTMDNRTRRDPYDHLSVNRQLQPNDQPFIVTGQKLMYPGDGSLGATAGNLINCLLPGTVVQGAVTAAMRSLYDGQAIEIELSRGSIVRVTKNHPIPTEDGLVAASDIQRGSKLLVDVVGIESPRRAFAGMPACFPANDDEMPAVVEQVFAALAISHAPEHCRSTAIDFHGDGGDCLGTIDIVRPEWVLRQQSELLANVGFVVSDASGRKKHADGPVASLRKAMLTTASGDVCGNGLRPALLIGHLGPFQAFGCAPVAQWDSTRSQDPVNRLSAGSILFGELIDAGAGLVTSDDVVRVKHFDYSGYVYDVETTAGWTIANGVVVSNCRCTSAASIAAVLKPRPRRPVGRVRVRIDGKDVKPRAALTK